MNGQYLPPKPNQDRDYQVAAQSMDDEWPEYSKKKRSKKPLIIILIVILVLIVAGVAYWLATDHKSNKPQPKNSSSSNVQPAPKGASSSSGTTKYVSNGQDLNLDFNYPSDWAVSPASNNNPNDQPITLDSPSTTIKGADGTSVTGKVTVLIRPGSAQMNELTTTTVTAAQNSVQFAYKQPTSSQHQYPYLTFLHFANSSSVAGSFEEVIVTGVQPFSKDEAITPGSLGGLDPIVAASFYSCKTTACSGQGAGSLGISNDSWQNTTVFKQVQAVLASFQFN